MLKANGETTQNGTQLRTCALRLAGVYGPGEQRHLPRIVVCMSADLNVCSSKFQTSHHRMYEVMEANTGHLPQQ